MRKLIAVLEHDRARAAVMASWLDDRLYMYDRFVEAEPAPLIASIGHRLDDVLVLCLNRESLGNFDPDEAEGDSIGEFLLSLPARFPILIHFLRESGPDDPSGPLIREGWSVTAIGPFRGLDWIGEQWYPAVRAAMDNHADLVRP